MRRSNRTLLAAGSVVAMVAIASACGPRQMVSAATHGTHATASPRVNELGRSELWAMHCTRCHNLRPRTEYSAEQWAVIVNHMRTIADLPGEDYRRLLEYLGDRAPVPAGTGAEVIARKEAAERPKAPQSP